MKQLLQLASLLVFAITLISCGGEDNSTPKPQISEIQPNSGPPGTSVTISGQGFQPNASNLSVSFDGTNSNVTSATSNKIQTEVPEELSEGSAQVSVTVGGETVTGPSFMVKAKAPGISSVEPDSGTVGTEVTIKGMNFSSKASEVSISFDGTSAQVRGAAKDQLITEVPQGATDGPIEVTIKQKSATGPEFDVITEGVLEVQTNTTGDDKDSDRYDMFIDGKDVASIANTGIATFPDLEKGSHDLELAGINGNCSVQGQNPRTVSITAGDTTAVTFDVACQDVAKNQIAFTSDRDGDTEIYLMNADGSNLTKITNNTYADAVPAISNDGTQIAFMSNRSGHLAIHVMNVDGSNVRKVTSPTADPETWGLISWSPDDKKLVYIDDRSRNQQLYTINIDGTGEQQLTDDSSTKGYVAWSPNGNKILYSSDVTGYSQIFTIEPDGTNKQQITSDGNNYQQPNWSPDGSKIALVSIPSGGNYVEIYTMNSDGTGLQRLTNSSSVDNLPNWSPDGSKLIFQSDRTGNREIFKSNADGTGSPINLTANNAVDYFSDWSPVE